MSNGRPSRDVRDGAGVWVHPAGDPPGLHARLDHAVELYRKQIAPLVITLGGGTDKDSGNTEGGVGRDYLLANGIPFANIIAETQSIDTEQQVHRLPF